MPSWKIHEFKRKRSLSKPETKHQIIISYLNNLKWYQEHKENEDYILFYKKRRGWYVKHIKDQETFFLGKNFNVIRRDFEKALFAWQVFGGNRELLNIKKVEM